MRSINTKLVKVILSSILITAIITTFFFIIVARRTIKNDAIDRLNEEATRIEALFINGESIDNIRDLLALRQLKISRPFVVGRLIFINDQKIYVTSSLNEQINLVNRQIVQKISSQLTESKKYISFDLNETKNIGIAYRLKITTSYSLNKDKVDLGWIFLYVPIEEIGLDRGIIRVFIIALVVSLLIGAGISIYFSRKITNPIKQLTLQSKKISERKFDEVEKLNTGDEFEELSEEFIKMSEKLSSYDNQQKEFFEIASHNLKTPLMSIKGYAESILDGVSTDNERSLNIIIDETDKLSELVKKILFISKSDSVDEFYNYEEQSIKEIFDEIYEKVSAITNENGLKLELEIKEDIIVNVDKEKIITAFMNILSNSVRYASSKISIKVNNINNDIIILINDDGAGFVDCDTDKIFERFYQGKNGNHGLGLYITKIIIEKHGGTIKARNNNDGASFVIVLHKKEYI